MKKKIELYVSVNAEEYHSVVTIYGESYRVEKTVWTDDEPLFPVTVDGITIYFDEPIAWVCVNKELDYRRD